MLFTISGLWFKLKFTNKYYKNNGFFLKTWTTYLNLYRDYLKLLLSLTLSERSNNRINTPVLITTNWMLPGAVINSTRTTVRQRRAAAAVAVIPAIRTSRTATSRRPLSIIMRPNRHPSAIRDRTRAPKATRQRCPHWRCSPSCFSWTFCRVAWRSTCRRWIRP